MCSSDLTGFTRSEVIGKTALAVGLVADSAGYAQRVAERLNDREESGREIARLPEGAPIVASRHAAGVSSWP